MPYRYTNSKNKQYYLNTKQVTMGNKKLYPVYYFSSDYRPETACDLPTGMSVTESKRSGLPLVKKDK